MGVRGLQTFLAENRQSLCRTMVLDGSERVPVVVDAMGIVFQLYLDTLPWATGGEYRRFYEIARRLVRAWREVGLDPVFVFDGATPPSKHTTSLARMKDKIPAARMFYALSPSTRSAPSFRNSMTVLPDFASQAFVAALRAENVPAHFVASGEADALCVAIARDLGGYVLGQDTDFVIFNSQYAPLNMLEWISAAEPQPGAGADDAEFIVVSKVKPKKQRLSHLLPPSEGCRLVLATYTSELLARRLRLPTTMLPLLASLVGNDYSPKRAADLFFAGVRPAERVDRVARVLREISAKTSGAGGDAVVGLVERAVTQLSKTHLDQRSRDALVDEFIDATMEYVLPLPDCCDTFPFCVRHGCDTPSPAGEAYAKAQKMGYAKKMGTICLFPDRVYIRSPLDDPGAANVRASDAAIASRAAGYAILDAEVGLRWPLNLEREEEIKQDKEAEALLGVAGEVNGEVNGRDDGTGHEDSDVSEGSDASEADDNEPSLEEAATDDAGDSADADSDSPTITVRQIVEYMRNGGTIAGRPILLPDPAPDYTSIALAPLETRLSTYLSTLGCPAASALPLHIQPLVAALRLAISNGTWRRSEVAAVLRGAIGSVEGWREAEKSEFTYEEVEPHHPLITNANAQRVAQFVGALHDLESLAQALLLTPEEGPDVTHLTPYVFVSGAVLHCLLEGVDPPESIWRWRKRWGSTYDKALAVVLEGMEVEEGGRRKGKKGRGAVPAAVRTPAKAKGAVAAGRFALLGMESA